MKITTDNKPRELVALFEIDKQEDFDYIKGDDAYTPRFVKYKGTWYDTHDTQGITTGKARIGWDMNVAPDSPLAKWDAIISESFFSGVLFRFVEDDEEVIVGRYTS